MTIYIAQVSPHDVVKVWEAEDESTVVRLCETDEMSFDTIDEAIAHDKKFSAYASSPWDLHKQAAQMGNAVFKVWDEIARRWGQDPDDAVDSSDSEEWGEETAGGTRLARFQADRIENLDGAEIGRVGEYDLIYLPGTDRAARVLNADAEWYDASSFRHASLACVGAVEDLA